MIAYTKFIVALALLVAVVAMVAQAEPDGDKVCKDVEGGNPECKSCCNKSGFLYGAFGGLIHQTCQCYSYSPEDPEIKAAGLSKIFGAAFTRDVKNL